MNEAAAVFRERIDRLLPALREAWDGWERHSLIGEPTFHPDVKHFSPDLNNFSGWPFEPQAWHMIPPMAATTMQKASIAVKGHVSRVLFAFLNDLPEPEPRPTIVAVIPTKGATQEAAQKEAAEFEYRCLPVGFALSMVEREAGTLAKDAAEHLQATIRAVVPDEPMRDALWGRRRELSQQWPWPMHTLPGICITLLILRFWAEGTPPGVLAEQALLCPEDWDPKSGSGPQAAAALRLLTGAIRKIEADRHRPAIAIEAGNNHRSLMEAWRDLPKDRRQPWTVDTYDERIELIRSGPAQLTLPLDLEEGLHAATIEALKDRELGGWFGLRNWAALNKLWSVEGGRRGFVTWDMDTHLEALGYSPSERRRNDTREKVARIVEGYTALELAIYDKSGTLRDRRPLVLVGRRVERQTRGRWMLEGAELQINPLLYQGVRPDPNGDLGCNWFPAPVELARIDHDKHRYALTLGLLLPIYWRLAWAENGADHITLSGRNLLRRAGIREARPDRWRILQVELEELKRHDALDRYQWESEPWTAAGMCSLWPSHWQRERTICGLRPVELPPAVIPKNGAELKQWRKDRELTQEQAAERLGVARRTYQYAEAAQEETIPDSLRKAFRDGKGV